MLRVSVIMPVLNEEGIIEETIRSLNDPRLELIVVDGGSRDKTASIVSRYKARLIPSMPGRGRQMNHGARCATKDILLFLHGDAKITEKGIDAMLKAMENPLIIGGAFRLAIDSRSPCLSFVALWANMRSIIFGLPYGDQGIFVRRSAFEEIGGYQDVPIMEDLEFIRRLKRRGKIRILGESISVSSRRWDKEGPIYTTLRNLILTAFFLLGVSPKKLYKWYKNIR
ncbi:MAG TPA: TIGR04283 family arsenosugar biosynthesis glycosyltransferase [Nitrospiria bacterium]|nr:TIGR04283 family arsenosugar biosynthesis glycosyltransferase [Nitrospiria bacterium]